MKINYTITIKPGPIRWYPKVRMINAMAADLFNNEEHHAAWFDAAYRGEDRLGITVTNAVTGVQHEFAYYTATKSLQASLSRSSSPYRQIVYKSTSNPALLLYVWEHIDNLLEWHNEMISKGLTNAPIPTAYSWPG